HTDRSIQVTTFSPDTTAIFKSDTEQQFYQSAEADFYTSTPSPIIPPTNLINQESDVNSIDELVLSGAPSSYLTEKQEQIRSSTPETIFNMEQENLFNNDNNQVEYISIYLTIDNTSIVNYWEVDQPQDRTEIDPWNPATGSQFQQVPLLEDTVLQLPGGFPGLQTWDHNQSQPTLPTGSNHTQ
ncbi:10788_t:CDS:2, partial [Dentiscutata erythropus]